MAKGEYALQVRPKLDAAIKAVDELGKSLEGMSGSVSKAGKQAGLMSAKFLSLGTVLVGTASSVAFIGAAVEKAMFQSRIAIERTGASADKLAEQIQGASRSAAALLPVGAQFSQLNFAGDQLDAVTQIAFEFSRSMGMSEKAAGAALAGIAAAAGLKTAPQIRQLASGIAAANKAFPDFSKGNIELLRTLGPTASEAKVTADAVMAANIAFQRAGISAGQAQTAIGEMLENFRYGPKQIAAFATALGLSRSEVAKFQALNPTQQFTEMFRVMREGGMVTRENVPMLMSYLGVTRDTADAMVKLAKSGKDTNDIFKMLNVETAKGTFVSEDYQRWTETLHGSLDTLWQLLRGVAETTAPVLTVALTGIVKAFTGVVWVVSKIPGPMRGVLVATLAVAGSMMLLGKVMSSQVAMSMLGGIKMLTGLTAALLAGDKATIKLMFSQMGLTKARLKDIGMTILQIGKNVLMAAGYVMLLPLILLEKAYLIAAAAVKFIYARVTAGSGVWSALLKEAGARTWNLATLAAEKIAMGIAATAKGAYAAATWIATTATGFFTGALGFLSTAVVVASVAFWEMAVAVAAATWPILLIIAAIALVIGVIVAVGYAIYKLVSFIKDNWDVIWGSMVATVEYLWGALKAGWAIMVSVGKAIWSFLITPIEKLWDLVKGVGDAIASPFKKLWGVIKGIGSAIGDTVGSLFGSSFLHIKEGVAGVMPALNRMEGAFTAVGQAANRVGLETGIPDDIRVRIAEPIGQIGRGRMSGVSDAMEGKQAFGGPAGSGPTGGITKPEATKGTAGAGEGVAGGGGGGRIVVPVTINLDGETIARVVQEYELNAGQERYMNAPAEALRGTGG